MSYRPTVPRLHFSGTFLADVSTVNNDPEHFNSARFRASYQKYHEEDVLNSNGWWNPEGTGSFALANCKTTSATYTDNTSVQSPLLDPAIGQTINGTQNSVQGKLVDLDSMAQTVSEIWGLRVNIGDDEMGFSSKLVNTPFMDLFNKFPPPVPGTDTGFSAIWHGVLNVSKMTKGESRFFDECSKYLSEKGETRMVIRMVADNFVQDRTADNYRYGRVVGCIRPWLPDQPIYFDAGRRLTPQSVTLSNAYAMLTENDGQMFAYIDVGNALPWIDSQTYVDQGEIFLCVLPKGAAGIAEQNYKVLGEIPYLDPDFYANTAGVMQIPLSSELAATAEGAPLGLIGLSKGSLTLLHAESDDGMFCRADLFVYRIDPGEFNSKNESNARKVDFYVTKFGNRCPDIKIGVAFDSTTMRAQATQGDIPGPRKVGAPQSALHLNSSGDSTMSNGASPEKGIDVLDSSIPSTYISTNEDGIASLTLSGGIINPLSEGDPKKRQNPRDYIDGQVYGLRYGVDEPPQVGQVTNSSDLINVLLFSMYDIPRVPSWIQHIAPIFTQYANLYPGMRRVVDLADYASCITRIWPLKCAFGTDLDDPHYMPVTRDLSDNKRTTILNWLSKNLDSKTKSPLYMDITCKDNLMSALQTAIELEHATVPPYLCALYSIKPGTNTFISDTIRSVVTEEMLHFSISCNILNSIGGSPNINKPDFVPKYPGPMPGGLRRGLIVRLRKLSYEQLRAFMSIEEPRYLIESDKGSVNMKDSENKLQREDFTIGFIYDKIKESLQYLHKAGKISFGHKERQLQGWSNPGDLNYILSLEDALKAIDQIEDQGEGSKPFSPVDEDKDPDTGLYELSHYYKFSEIVHGRRIVVHEDKSFSYTGDRIILEEDGVYSMMDDPDVSQLTKGSKQRLMAENFSRKYRALLNALHDTMNGNPGYVHKAIAAMFQLTISAQPLMEMDANNGDGTTVGLSFQVPLLD